MESKRVLAAGRDGVTAAGSRYPGVGRWRLVDADEVDGVGVSVSCWVLGFGFWSL